MTTITINRKNHTIEMPSKKYALAASKYGSDEYIEVQNARRDYPNYKVVTKSIKRTDPLKGITYEKMKKHIENCDSGSENEKFFKSLIDSKSARKATYGEVKAWFTKTYFPQYSKNDKNEEQSSTNAQ